jgi:hypothetical protein
MFGEISMRISSAPFVNKRQLMIGMGTLSGTLLAMRASIVLAAEDQKAAFIKAAMAELD